MDKQIAFPEGFMNEAALNGDLLKSKKIRATALCIFRKDDRIFVALGYDPLREKHFYRPLGGSIEFGERGHEAVVRELREETGLVVCNLHYLGLVENIFTYNGDMGHEIALVYEGEFTDSSVYDREKVECFEDGGESFIAVWKSLDDFHAEVPLYPEGLLNLLTEDLTGRTSRSIQ